MNLLADAGKGFSLFLGAVCGVISATFAALFLFLLYVVGWRNPREYGTNDLFKPVTVTLFLFLLSIAIGFGVLAFRTLSPRRNRVDLLSPLALRVWAAFFAVMGVYIAVVTTLKGNASEAYHAWIVVPTVMTMASAAFILARYRERIATRKQSLNHPTNNFPKAFKDRLNKR